MGYNIGIKLFYIVNSDFIGRLLLQLCRTLSGFLKLINNNLFIKFNPLTPVLAVTGRDVPWPFFHFWRHHLGPKLALPMLNFCRGKRSFQLYADQSDQPNGA